ncbi:MAG TPA: hypothetical protein VMU10_08030 [Desulfomonilia bacterium]|nr:hypothetical protein [Desulfomonilia bacterium]
MRYFRIAMTIGILSACLLTLAFSYYLHTMKDVKFKQAKLETILATNAQRKNYVKKIESIKAYSSKLINLSHEKGADVDYEIVLTEPDVKKLFSEVASTYSEGMFFLDKAVVESTSGGIKVDMKGFKIGGGN